VASTFGTRRTILSRRAGQRAERLGRSELPLGRFRAVEDEFGRLVVCVVGEPELGIGGQPVFAAFGASRDQCNLFRAPAMSISRVRSNASSGRACGRRTEAFAPASLEGRVTLAAVSPCRSLDVPCREGAKTALRGPASQGMAEHTYRLRAAGGRWILSPRLQLHPSPCGLLVKTEGATGRIQSRLRLPECLLRNQSRRLTGRDHSGLPMSFRGDSVCGSSAAARSAA